VLNSTFYAVLLLSSNYSWTAFWSVKLQLNFHLYIEPYWIETIFYCRDDKVISIMHARKLSINGKTVFIWMGLYLSLWGVDLFICDLFRDSNLISEREKADLSHHLDIHSMCGLVKLFLRELPEALITPEVLQCIPEKEGLLYSIYYQVTWNQHLFASPWAIGWKSPFQIVWWEAKTNLCSILF